MAQSAFPFVHFIHTIPTVWLAVIHKARDNWVTGDRIRTDNNVVRLPLTESVLKNRTRQTKVEPRVPQTALNYKPKERGGSATDDIKIKSEAVQSINLGRKVRRKEGRKVRRRRRRTAATTTTTK